MENASFPTMTPSEVVELIKCVSEGLNDGYFQNAFFLNTDNMLHTVVREYLLTVIVAQKLHIWTVSNRKYHYSVRLEFKAIEFMKAAFPSYILSPRENSFLELDINGRSEKEIERDGYIDVSLFEDGPNGLQNAPRSIAAIELKAINPKSSLAISDLQRLAQILNTTDASMGANSVQFCVLGYINRLDNPNRIFSETQYQQLQEEHRASVQKWLMSVNIGLLNAYVLMRPITKSTEEEYLQRINPDEGDYADFADAVRETGALNSVVIILSPTIIQYTPGHEELFSML
ncbi:MAG: hypothetical protein EOP04_01740 [Proteobacteria bacterium]|nr:MAG: hypothetical protein EOP04_01740 [Pseudomonadota bacterium]